MHLKFRLPPLRDRGDDIMEFALFFVERANKAFNKSITGFDDETKALIYRYAWHGNIRELQNVINRAVLLSQGDTIKPDVMPGEIRFYNAIRFKNDGSHSRNEITELKQAPLVTEKEVIINALIESNYNKSKAAKMLNIDRKTLYNKIKQYEIEILK
jgi:two-component system, NtrC family, response regulator HydG